MLWTIISKSGACDDLIRLECPGQYSIINIVPKLCGVEGQTSCKKSVDDDDDDEEPPSFDL